VIQFIETAKKTVTVIKSNCHYWKVSLKLKELQHKSNTNLKTQHKQQQTQTKAIQQNV